MTETTRFNSKSLEVIGDDTHNLWVSLDCADDPTVAHPVFLFTPHMANTDEHYHIELNAEQAAVLRDWLNQNVRNASHD